MPQYIDMYVRTHMALPGYTENNKYSASENSCLFIRAARAPGRYLYFEFSNYYIY